MGIVNVQEELTSSLPAYIRSYFRSYKGFNTWCELFGANIDVSKTSFAEKYSAKCKVDKQ